MARKRFEPRLKHVYSVKMLYNWYDDLLPTVMSIVDDDILYHRRYSDGSTTCQVVFKSVIHKDMLDDMLRASLNNWHGWMELIDVGGEM